jgi:translation initiation factor 1 (eIF-1/SUI1)
VTKRRTWTEGGYHSGRATPRSPWTPPHGNVANYASTAVPSRSFGHFIEGAYNGVVVGATLHPSITVSSRPPVVIAPVTTQDTKGGYHFGKKHTGTSALGLSDLVRFNPVVDFGDDHQVPVDVLGRKIIISVQKAPHLVTIIDGVTAPLAELLKKLRKLLSCGGHVAKDKKTGSEFIQLLGGSDASATKVAQFLIQEGICDARACIVCRGWSWV